MLPETSMFRLFLCGSHLKSLKARQRINWRLLKVSGFLSLGPWHNLSGGPFSCVNFKYGYHIWRKSLDLAAFSHGNAEGEWSLEQLSFKQKHLPDWDEQESHVFMASVSMGKGGQNLRCTPNQTSSPSQNENSSPGQNTCLVPRLNV